MSHTVEKHRGELVELEGEITSGLVLLEKVETLQEPAKLHLKDLQGALLNAKYDINALLNLK